MARKTQRKRSRATSRPRPRSRGRKNRKKNEVKVVFPSPLAAVLVAAACLSLVYLWFCGRCDALGKEMSGLERQRAEIRGRVLNEEFNWTNMRAPGNMDLVLRRHRLVMCLPDEENIVRVRASALALVPTTPPEGHTAQYAQTAGAFVND